MTKEPPENRPTRILRVDPEAPEPELITQAAEILRSGGLVAFPTETVYGLGANALDPQAILRVFAAKGRPANNPLIVHVPDTAGARAVVAHWPEVAARLADRFWPGPLTLVLAKHSRIPEVVTAGGPTVAVRVPANNIAQALLSGAAVPVAAPSANRSQRLSPTRAEHVLRDLEDRIDMVLDGGPTSGGLESTVLDLTTTPPRILRPGLVLAREIEPICGPITQSELAKNSAPPSILSSPGMLPRHYAPRAPLEVLPEDECRARIKTLVEQGIRVGYLGLGALLDAEAPGVIQIVMPTEARGYTARLYAALHELDAAGVERILVALPPGTEEWQAVRDRLRRASAG